MGSIAQELTRAAAQHGRLDPVYQELSDDWTALLQRLFPVWTLIGPGLAEPGHILLRTRTVYLDSDELLGSRDEIVAGTLEQRAILRTFGVGIHEVLHAKHTKLWVSDHDAALSKSDDPAEQQLAEDRRLLEEPRMEATGCREFPEQTGRGRFVRGALGVAVTDCIVPRFLEQFAQAAVAGKPLTRDMAGRAMTYVQARTHYDVVDAAALTALQAIWKKALGDADFAKLDDLYARLVWVDDGDNHTLSAFAKEYRDIIGPPDPPEGGADGADGQAVPGAGNGGNGGSGGGDDDGSGDGPGSGTGNGSGGGSQPTVGSLKEALDQALEQSAAGQLEQLNEDVDLKDTLARAAGADSPDANGGGTGAPTGRMPDRGVDRPPMPDEVLLARRLAQRLLQALTMGTRTIDKRTPGGRFSGRAYARGRAERAQGRPVSAHPWRVIRHITAPIQEPHVLLVIDTSGSMSAYEYALGPIVWILQEAFRAMNGRVAVSLFGNGAELLTDGSTPMTQVPGIKVGGGTAFAGDAIVMGAEHLEMTNPRRPRAVYVISDGGWYDTESGVQKIRWLAELGVPTIHLSIGAPPLSVEAERVCVIADPADVLDIVATDTVEALRGAASGRRRTPAAAV